MVNPSGAQKAIKFKAKSLSVALLIGLCLAACGDEKSYVLPIYVVEDLADGYLRLPNSGDNFEGVVREENRNLDCKQKPLECIEQISTALSELGSLGVDTRRYLGLDSGTIDAIVSIVEDAKDELQSKCLTELPKEMMELANLRAEITDAALGYYSGIPEKDRNNEQWDRIVEDVVNGNNSFEGFKARAKELKAFRTFCSGSEIESDEIPNFMAKAMRFEENKSMIRESIEMLSSGIFDRKVPRNPWRRSHNYPTVLQALYKRATEGSSRLVAIRSVAAEIIARESGELTKKPSDLRILNETIRLNWSSIVDDTFSFFPSLPLDEAVLSFSDKGIQLARNLSLSAQMAIQIESGDQSLESAVSSIFRQSVAISCTRNAKAKYTGRSQDVVCSSRSSTADLVGAGELIGELRRIQGDVVGDLGIVTLSTGKLDSDISAENINLSVSLRLPDEATLKFDFHAETDWRESYHRALQAGLSKLDVLAFDGISSTIYMLPETLVAYTHTTNGSERITGLAYKISTASGVRQYLKVGLVLEDAVLRVLREDPLPVHSLWAYLFDEDSLLRLDHCNAANSGCGPTEFKYPFDWYSEDKVTEALAAKLVVEMEPLAKFLRNQSDFEPQLCDVLSTEKFHHSYRSYGDHTCRKDKALDIRTISKSNLKHAISIAQDESQQWQEALDVALGLSDSYELDDKSYPLLFSASSNDFSPLAIRGDQASADFVTASIFSALSDERKLPDLVPTMVSSLMCSSDECDISVRRKTWISRALVKLKRRYRQMGIGRDLEKLSVLKVIPIEVEIASNILDEARAVCGEEVESYRMPIDNLHSVRVTCEDGLPKAVVRTRTKGANNGFFQVFEKSESSLLWPGRYKLLEGEVVGVNQPGQATTSCTEDSNVRLYDLITCRIVHYTTDIAYLMERNVDWADLHARSNNTLERLLLSMPRASIAKNIDSLTIEVLYHLACYSNFCPRLDRIDNQRAIVWELEGKDLELYVSGHNADGFRKKRFHDYSRSDLVATPTEISSEDVDLNPSLLKDSTAGIQLPKIFHSAYGQNERDTAERCDLWNLNPTECINAASDEVDLRLGILTADSCGATEVFSNATGTCLNSGKTRKDFIMERVAFLDHWLKLSACVSTEPDCKFAVARVYYSREEICPNGSNKCVAVDYGVKDPLNIDYDDFFGDITLMLKGLHTQLVVPADSERSDCQTREQVSCSQTDFVDVGIDDEKAPDSQARTEELEGERYETQLWAERHFPTRLYALKRQGTQREAGTLDKPDIATLDERVAFSCSLNTVLIEQEGTRPMIQWQRDGVSGDCLSDSETTHEAVNLLAPSAIVQMLSALTDDTSRLPAHLLVSTTLQDVKRDKEQDSSTLGDNPATGVSQDSRASGFLLSVRVSSNGSLLSNRNYKLTLGSEGRKPEFVHYSHVLCPAELSSCSLLVSLLSLDVAPTLHDIVAFDETKQSLVDRLVTSLFAGSTKTGEAPLVVDCSSESCLVHSEKSRQVKVSQKDIVCPGSFSAFDAESLGKQYCRQGLWDSMSMTTIDKQLHQKSNSTLFSVRLEQCWIPKLAESKEEWEITERIVEISLLDYLQGKAGRYDCKTGAKRARNAFVQDMLMQPFRRSDDSIALGNFSGSVESAFLSYLALNDSSSGQHGGKEGYIAEAQTGATFDVCLHGEKENKKNCLNNYKEAVNNALELYLDKIRSDLSEVLKSSHTFTDCQIELVDQPGRPAPAAFRMECSEPKLSITLGSQVVRNPSFLLDTVREYDPKVQEVMLKREAFENLRSSIKAFAGLESDYVCNQARCGFTLRNGDSYEVTPHRPASVKYQFEKVEASIMQLVKTHVTLKLKDSLRQKLVSVPEFQEGVPEIIDLVAVECKSENGSIECIGSFRGNEIARIESENITLSNSLLFDLAIPAPDSDVCDLVKGHVRTILSSRVWSPTDCVAGGDFTFNLFGEAITIPEVPSTASEINAFMNEVLADAIGNAIESSAWSAITLPNEECDKLLGTLDNALSQAGAGDLLRSRIVGLIPSCQLAGFKALFSGSDPQFRSQIRDVAFEQLAQQFCESDAVAGMHSTVICSSSGYPIAVNLFDDIVLELQQDDIIVTEDGLTPHYACRRLEVDLQRVARNADLTVRVECDPMNLSATTVNWMLPEGEVVQYTGIAQLGHLLNSKDVDRRLHRRVLAAEREFQLEYCAEVGREVSSVIDSLGWRSRGSFEPAICGPDTRSILLNLGGSEPVVMAYLQLIYPKQSAHLVMLEVLMRKPDHWLDELLVIVESSLAHYVAEASRTYREQVCTRLQEAATTMSVLAQAAASIVQCNDQGILLAYGADYSELYPIPSNQDEMTDVVKNASDWMTLQSRKSVITALKAEYAAHCAQIVQDSNTALNDFQLLEIISNFEVESCSSDVLQLGFTSDGVHHKLSIDTTGDLDSVAVLARNEVLQIVHDRVIELLQDRVSTVLPQSFRLEAGADSVTIYHAGNEYLFVLTQDLLIQLERHIKRAGAENAVYAMNQRFKLLSLPLVLTCLDGIDACDLTWRGTTLDTPSRAELQALGSYEEDLLKDYATNLLVQWIQNSVFRHGEKVSIKLDGQTLMLTVPNFECEVSLQVSQLADVHSLAASLIRKCSALAGEVKGTIAGYSMAIHPANLNTFSVVNNSLIQGQSEHVKFNLGSTSAGDFVVIATATRAIASDIHLYVEDDSLRAFLVRTNGSDQINITLHKAAIQRLSPESFLRDTGRAYAVYQASHAISETTDRLLDFVCTPRQLTSEAFPVPVELRCDERGGPALAFTLLGEMFTIVSGLRVYQESAVPKLKREGDFVVYPDLEAAMARKLSALFDRIEVDRVDLDERLITGFVFVDRLGLDIPFAIEIASGSLSTPLAIDSLRKAIFCKSMESGFFQYPAQISEDIPSIQLLSRGRCVSHPSTYFEQPFEVLISAGGNIALPGVLRIGLEGDAEVHLDYSKLERLALDAMLGKLGVTSNTLQSVFRELGLEIVDPYYRRNVDSTDVYMRLNMKPTFLAGTGFGAIVGHFWLGRNGVEFDGKLETRADFWVDTGTFAFGDFGVGLNPQEKSFILQGSATLSPGETNGKVARLKGSVHIPFKDFKGISFVGDLEALEAGSLGQVTACIGHSSSKPCQRDEIAEQVWANLEFSGGIPAVPILTLEAAAFAYSKLDPYAIEMRGSMTALGKDFATAALTFDKDLLGSFESRTKIAGIWLNLHAELLPTLVPYGAGFDFGIDNFVDVAGYASLKDRGTVVASVETKGVLKLLPDVTIRANNFDELMRSIFALSLKLDLDLSLPKDLQFGSGTGGDDGGAVEEQKLVWDTAPPEKVKPQRIPPVELVVPNGFSFNKACLQHNADPCKLRPKPCKTIFGRGDWCKILPSSDDGWIPGWCSRPSREGVEGVEGVECAAVADFFDSIRCEQEPCKSRNRTFSDDSSYVSIHNFALGKSNSKLGIARSGMGNSSKRVKLFRLRDDGGPLSEKQLETGSTNCGKTYVEIVDREESFDLSRFSFKTFYVPFEASNESCFDPATKVAVVYPHPQHDNHAIAYRHCSGSCAYLGEPKQGSAITVSLGPLADTTGEWSGGPNQVQSMLHVLTDWALTEPTTSLTILDYKAANNNVEYALGVGQVGNGSAIAVVTMVDYQTTLLKSEYEPVFRVLNPPPPPQGSPSNSNFTVPDSPAFDSFIQNCTVDAGDTKGIQARSSRICGDALYLDEEGSLILLTRNNGENLTYTPFLAFVESNSNGTDFNAILGEWRPTPGWMKFVDAPDSEFDLSAGQKIKEFLGKSTNDKNLKSQLLLGIDEERVLRVVARDESESCYFDNESAFVGNSSLEWGSFAQFGAIFKERLDQFSGSAMQRTDNQQRLEIALNGLTDNSWREHMDEPLLLANPIGLFHSRLQESDEKCVQRSVN